MRDEDDDAGKWRRGEIFSCLHALSKRGIAEANGSDTTGPEVCDVENRRVFVITPALLENSPRARLLCYNEGDMTEE